MIRKYHMGVYPRTLFIAVDETEESILKFLNGNDGDEIPKLDEDSNADAMRVSDGKYGGVLIRYRGIQQMTNGIIAHECFHTIMLFCSYLGINIDRDGDNEHIAYMVQWAVDKCTEVKYDYEKENYKKENAD